MTTLKNIIAVFILTTPLTLFAQDKVFEVVDIGAEYMKGEQAMYELFEANKRWPKEAVEMGIKGKVGLHFVVTTSGKIEDVVVDFGLGYGLDEEAVRLILLTDGFWKPAFKDGKAVNSYVALPIRFF